MTYWTLQRSVQTPCHEISLAPLNGPRHPTTSATPSTPSTPSTPHDSLDSPRCQATSRGTH
eukprot:13825025-Alexandrium_andersonii.AAC.1